MRSFSGTVSGSNVLSNNWVISFDRGSYSSYGELRILFVVGCPPTAIIVLCVVGCPIIVVLAKKFTIFADF